MNFKDTGITEKMFDTNKYFGEMTFLGLHGNNFVTEENGERGELRKRVYNCISSAQKKVMRISIKADVNEKSFPVNEPVKLVNPSIHFMANYSYENRKMEVIPYIYADDIVALNTNNRPSTPLPTPPVPPKQEDKKPT